MATNTPEVQATPPASQAASASRKRRILLVEDTELNRLVTLAMLGTGNYTVDSAASGLEALDALKDVHYDLVLMDVSMPNMDGFEATRAIRAMDGPMSRVPIVAMTAHAMVGDRERCLASGMDDYLPKPVSRADLLAKVEHFVSNGRNPESVAGGPEADRVIDDRTLEALTADTNPDTLRGLVETMLPEMNKRLDAIEAGCANRDATAVAHGAHSLKSMAATFGARAVERLAQAIEDLARTGSLGEAADLVSPLRAAATRADEALRKVRATA
ncbi:MAG: response regulator [Alphaproteobacteria bacterium]